MKKNISPKIKPDFSDNVAETLMIALAMKCRETAHPKSIFQDPESCRMMEEIDYDFDKFKAGKASAAGVVCRAKDFDRVTQQFILGCRNPVVVIIGCGLDTRYSRIAEWKNAVFYELDLPEVIDLRRKLIPEQANQHFIAASLLEKGWMDDLLQRHHDAKFLFLAEGVLMYFKEEQVKDFFQNIAARFHGSKIYLDTLTKWMSKKTGQHDTVSKTGASFHWGIDDLREPESWAPNIRLKDVFYFMTETKGHWPLLQTIMKVVPKFGKSSRNVLYEIL